jgi:SAM-dependent methyltransferase
VAERARQRTVSAAGYLDYDYDRFYSESDFDYVERVEAAFVGAILRGLLRLPRGAEVVDMGCGTGFDTWLMDRMGYRAVGVDISPVGIEKARRRGGGARYVLADALAGAAEIGGPFDLVYCSGFMAFNWVASLEEPNALETARVLLDYARPGGWLVFLWDSLLTGERWSPYPDLEPDRMFMNYTVAQLRRLWEQVGGCYDRHAGTTHKRVAPLLGRRAFCRPVDRLLTPLARRLRRPVQVVLLIQRGPAPPFHHDSNVNR